MAPLWDLLLRRARLQRSASEVLHRSVVHPRPRRVLSFRLVREADAARRVCDDPGLCQPLACCLRFGLPSAGVPPHARLLHEPGDGLAETNPCSVKRRVRVEPCSVRP